MKHFVKTTAAVGYGKEHSCRAQEGHWDLPLHRYVTDTHSPNTLTHPHGIGQPSTPPTSTPTHMFINYGDFQLRPEVV